jgi:hypothetical protein
MMQRRAFPNLPLTLFYQSTFGLKSAAKADSTTGSSERVDTGCAPPSVTRGWKLGGHPAELEDRRRCRNWQNEPKFYFYTAQFTDSYVQLITRARNLIS